MEWLLIIGGIIVLLAFIDRLKLFGATRDRSDSDDTPLTARETAAGAASTGGLLLRSAMEVTRELPAAADQLNSRAEKWATATKVDRAQHESALGKSLVYRKALLASMLKFQKQQLDILDRCDADPQFARLFQKHYDSLKSIEDPKGRPNSPSVAQKELQALGFVAPPVNLRIMSIPFLYHFTRAENLSSILKHGIVPVAMCRERGINPVINDEARLDRHTNTSSFSIGHPNGRMLHKYRQLHPDADWVVLAVSVTAIHFDTLFCRHNAADGRISSLSDNDLKMDKAFQGMFERPPRYTGQARYNEPTDDQAEILIPRIIPKSEIHGAFFLSENVRADHISACGDLAVFDSGQSAAIFGKRKDSALNHTARILKGFNEQIEELAVEFKRDPRLFDALDKEIYTSFSNSGLPARAATMMWLDQSF